MASMRRVLLAAIFVFCLAPVLVNADTYLSYADPSDGYWHDVPRPGTDQWYGSGETITVSYYSSYRGKTINTGYVQYDLNDAPDPSQIQAVTLNLDITHKNTYCYGWIRYRPQSTTANGNAAQRIDGTQNVATISGSDTGWASFDVTDLIKSDLEGGYSWAPFSFQDPRGFVWIRYMVIS